MTSGDDAVESLASARIDTVDSNARADSDEGDASFGAAGAVEPSTAESATAETVPTIPDVKNAAFNESVIGDVSHKSLDCYPHRLPKFVTFH